MEVLDMLDNNLYSKKSYYDDVDKKPSTVVRVFTEHLSQLTELPEWLKEYGFELEVNHDHEFLTELKNYLHRIDELVKDYV